MAFKAFFDALNFNEVLNFGLQAAVMSCGMLSFGGTLSFDDCSLNSV